MAVPTQRADAFSAAAFLYQYVFWTFGPMTTLLSDNGAHFANQVLRGYCKLVNAHHKFTTPLLPPMQWYRREIQWCARYIVKEALASQAQGMG